MRILDESPRPRAPAARYPPPWARNALACFLLGTLNNLTLVINNAGATTILPGEVGVIYVVNVVPELIVKATAPFWWHMASYRVKICLVGVLFGCNIVLVHSGLELPVWAKLIGVALNDIGSGLGEASVLALSQFYANPRTLLTAWSSGTGMAGIAGYLISMYAIPSLSVTGRLLLGGTVLIAYWLAFFCLLETPWVDGLRAGRPRGRSSDEARASTTRSRRVLASGAVNSAPLLLAVDDSGGAADSGGALESSTGAPPGVSGAADATGARADAPVSPLAPPPPPPHHHHDAAAHMTAVEKLRLQGTLLRFVLPLMLVYWAEYAAQAGAWTAFALPPHALDDERARVRAYQQLNLAYQVGVFVSRSSGKLFRLRVLWLWAVAGLQVRRHARAAASGDPH